MADSRGANISIEDPGPPITAEQLEVLECIIEAVLPASLRELLLKHNGGHPKPKTFEVADHREHLFDVQIFYGISRIIESSNLEWNYREFFDIHGKNWIAFARTDTGDQILLDLNERSVWFWDSAEDDPTQRYYRIANSHAEFLSSLRDEGY
jgi:cell wall assembly regulator SMI1